MKYKEKRVIGESDYTREEIESGKTNGSFGTPAIIFKARLAEYEKQGYTIKFETSIFRKIFAVGKYKIVAYK